MTFRGHVEWVESTTPRGFLASDQILGASSLPIYGADSFVSTTNSGSVVIDGSTYAYSSVTTSADESVTPSTLVVSPGLVQAEVNGEPIELVSADETKFAGVSTGDGIGDVMRVRVPHSLKSYSALTDGVRAAGTQETVDVDRVNGELVVTNVVGVSDVFDASTTPIVTSTAGGEVVRIDGDGITLSTNNVVEQLSIPLTDPNAAVAVDKAGFIYIGQVVDGKIHKYTPAGVEVTTGGFPIATPSSGLAFDSTNRIYSLDRTSNMVRTFSTAGVAGATWTTVGDPIAISINSVNQVFIYDDTASVLRRFTTAGVQTVTGNFPFSAPANVFAIDSSDRLNFPSGTGIDRYDANASPVAGITGPVLSGNQFAVGPDGSFYLGRAGNLGVDKFSAAGAFIGSIVTTWQFQFVTIAPTSQILLTDPTNQLLHEYNGVDNLRATVQLFSADGRVVAGQAKISGALEVNQIVAPNTLKIVGGLADLNVVGLASAPYLDNRITPTLTNGTGTSEVLVAKWTIPAGYFTAGQMAEAKLMSQQSSTATLIWRVRMGSAGTTADALLIQFATTPAGVANAHQFANIMVNCLTQGATGTMTAGGFVSHGTDLGNGVGPLASAFAAATVDTTQSRILSISVQQSASQTLTVRGASLSKMRG